MKQNNYINNIHLYRVCPNKIEIHDLEPDKLHLCLANRGIYKDESIKFEFKVVATAGTDREDILYIVWNLRQNYDQNFANQLPAILIDPVFNCEMKLYTSQDITYYQGKKHGVIEND